MEIFFILAKFILGFFLLVKGAGFLIEFAIFIAKRFGLSRTFVGFTLVSLGTSLPELLVSHVAIFLEKNAEVASKLVLGNVLGSNIANISLVLAISLIFYPIRFSLSFLKRDISLGLLSIIFCHLMIFFVFPAIYISDFSAEKSFMEKFLVNHYRWTFFSRWVGGIFLVLGLGYSVYVFHSTKGDAFSVEDAEQNAGKKKSMIISIFWVLGSIFAMQLGAKWIIYGAYFIANDLLGINEKIVALTMVAWGTSLPELAASIFSARKREYKILLGNIMGSNIFNVFFVAASAALVQPLVVTEKAFLGSFAFDNYFLFIIMLTLSIFVFFNRKEKIIGRGTGCALLLLNFIYLSYLIFIS